MYDECSKCHNNIYVEPPIICAGVCRRSFHRQCCGLTKERRNLIAKSVNLFWCCDKCCSADMPVILSDLEKLRSTIDFIARTVVMQEERMRLTDGATSYACLPRASFFKYEHPLEGQKTESAPKTTSSYTVGENVTSIGLKAAVVPERRCLYVSRVSKDYTFYDVLLYIARNLQIDVLNMHKRIQCVPLYNVNEGLDHMPYLSFKVKLDEGDYNRVNNASFWPQGIVIRQFSRYSIRNRAPLPPPPQTVDRATQTTEADTGPGARAIMALDNDPLGINMFHPSSVYCPNNTVPNYYDPPSIYPSYPYF